MPEMRFSEDDRIDKIKKDFFNKCKAFLIRNYKPVDNDNTSSKYLSTYQIFTAVQDRHPSRQYKESDVERWLTELNFSKENNAGSTYKNWLVKGYKKRL